MAEDRANTFLRMIRRSRRGRLKIYLGYGAGVGKTYQMLQEGHRLTGEGLDVVVGLIETHGRIETAKLVQGLEVIPRKRQEYRGHILEEMDADAVLNRRPEVVLIDELPTPMCLAAEIPNVILMFKTFWPRGYTLSRL